MVQNIDKSDYQVFQGNIGQYPLFFPVHPFNPDYPSSDRKTRQKAYSAPNFFSFSFVLCS